MPFGSNAEQLVKRTPSGILLPPGVDHKGAQPEKTGSYSLWTGKIPVQNPDAISEVVDKELPLRREIMILMKKFIKHYLQDISSNTSFTMLLTSQGDTPSYIEIGIGDNHRGWIRIITSPPASTIAMLKDQNRVINRI